MSVQSTGTTKLQERRGELLEQTYELAGSNSSDVLLTENKKVCKETQQKRSETQKVLKRSTKQVRAGVGRKQEMGQWATPL